MLLTAPVLLSRALLESPGDPTGISEWRLTPSNPWDEPPASLEQDAEALACHVLAKKLCRSPVTPIEDVSNRTDDLVACLWLQDDSAAADSLPLYLNSTLQMGARVPRAVPGALAHVLLWHPWLRPTALQPYEDSRTRCDSACAVP